MADQFSEARERAKKTITAKWLELAKTRTLGWGDPVEAVVKKYSFIKASADSLGSRIVRDLPLMIFQSRESPPQDMEVAIPFRDPTGNPFNSRIASSAQLAQGDVMLRSEIAQAIWFLLDQNVLPSPRQGRAFQDALLAMTGKALFEL